MAREDPPNRRGPGERRRGTSTSAGPGVVLGLRVRRDLHLDDLVLRRGHDAVGIAVAPLDPLPEFHPLNHLAPDGVLAVELGHGGVADGEIAVWAVLVLWPRHRDTAAAPMCVAAFRRAPP